MTNLTPYTDSDSPKKEQIRDMFDSIAPKYDFLNHFLSLGIDRYWRRVLVRDLAKENPSRVLDVATGTGDLAIAIARSGARRVTGVDLSPGMLEKGRSKVRKAGLDIDMQIADVEALGFADGSFDAVTAAFGVRNFGNPLAGLSQMYRVLGDNGIIYVLEFSKPDSSLLSYLFRIYFHKILPAVGKVVSRDRGAYKYLPMSVDAFPSGELFAGLLARAGFNDITMNRLTGGVVTIYKAVK